MTYFLVIQSCTGAVNHVHLFRRRTFPVTFNALLDMVPSLTTCTFSRSIGVFTRWLIQHFAIFCDHLSRPLIWREFLFHTSLACSETDRHQCHLIYINPFYLSPVYLCTQQGSKFNKFLPFCDHLPRPMIWHKSSHALASLLYFFPRSNKNCTNPVGF